MRLPDRAPPSVSGPPGGPYRTGSGGVQTGNACVGLGGLLRGSLTVLAMQPHRIK